jgi:outer membrane protein OmpA-like peptidoglycan-associated protein
MRFATTVTVAAGFWLATTSLVLAQGSVSGVDSGLEVRVNPYAARPGSGMLLYPGGEYSRNVPALLYPGERGGPIRLHMPSRRRIVHAAPKRVAAAEPDAEPAPAPPPVKRTAKAAPKAVPKAAPAPAPSTMPQADASPYFGAPNLSNVFGAQPQKPAPQPQRVAKASPPPASSSGEAGLTKRSVILFAKDAADPAEGALGAIKFLAGDLNNAMTGPGSRIELQAFGGGKGDKSSDARRLSLKRALSIRQVLIDDGVSADRIDVRAMGGADDSGPADRVDVYVRA